MNVEDTTAAEPHVFTLHQNAPNPFNQATEISFELDRPCEAALVVYDLLGRVVAEPARDWFAVGTHTVVWDGCDRTGTPVSSGIYLYRLAAFGRSQAGRMTVVR